MEIVRATPPNRRLPARVQPTMIYCPHPISMDVGRVQATAPFRPGETIDGYLARQGLDLGGRPVRLYLNDRPVARAAWRTTCPMPGDLITIRARVQGGGGGGSNPIRTILSLAVLLVAPQFAPGLAGALNISSEAALALISVGGSLVINAFFPPPSPTMAQLGHEEATSPTYSLSGGSNRARPYGPLPLLLGEHRIYPDYGARTYTEFDGEDQILYQVFNFGLSDLELSDFRIGATPIGDYDDVEIEVSGDDGRLTLFPGNVDTYTGGALAEGDVEIVRTGSVDTTAIAIDITGTLFAINDRGTSVAHSVTLRMEYRTVGDAQWSPIVPNQPQVVVTNASRKPLRRTWRVTVPGGQYEVRIRRLTPSDTDDRHFSNITWSQMRCYQPDSADYTGQRRVALKIKASGQISGQVQRFSALGRARIPVWTGAEWETRVSANPAWQVLWLARGKRIGNRRVFGGDLPDSRINIDALKEWAVWCDAKNLRCNMVFDRPINTDEMIQTVARVGRAVGTWAGGRLGVVWDQADLPHQQVFGMANIRRGTFRVDYVTARLADEIVGQFVDPASDWQPVPVRATVPGVADPVNPADIGLMVGVTDRDQAGRELLLQAARQKYWRRRITWETDIEGLVVNRGGVALISHDLTQWGYSGRLVAATRHQLTLDRKVPFTPGKVHYVGVRFPDGFFGHYEVAYVAGETDTLQLVDPLPADPGADDQNPVVDYVWMFEPLDLGGDTVPGKRVKLVDVRRSGLHHVRLVAVDDSPDYYLAEYGDFTCLGPEVHGVELPRITALDIDETLVESGPGYTVQISLAWDVTGPYGGAFIRARVGDEPMQDRGRTPSRRYEFLVPDSGEVELEVVAFDLLGRWSDQSKRRTVYTIRGKSALPPDVIEFLVARQPDGTRQFTWSAPEPADLAGYEIRYQAGTGHSWETMHPLNAQGLIPASPWETNQVPKGTWTFAIKMADTSGNRSQNARYIETDLGDPRMADVAVAEDAGGMGWPGVRTNCFVSARGELEAVDPTTWADLGGKTWADMATWADNPASSMVYEHTTDAGGELQFTPLVEAVAYGDVTVEYSTSSDNVTWSSWSTTAAPARARWLRVRVTVSNHALPRLRRLNVMLSAKALRDEINDLDTATVTGAQRIGVGDIRLPLISDFVIITQVQLALQNVGAGWSWDIVDKDAALGPRVRIYDSAGSPADCTIDAYIRGV